MEATARSKEYLLVLWDRRASNTDLIFLCKELKHSPCLLSGPQQPLGIFRIVSKSILPQFYNSSLYNVFDGVGDTLPCTDLMNNLAIGVLNIIRCKPNEIRTLSRSLARPPKRSMRCTSSGLMLYSTPTSSSLWLMYDTELAGSASVRATVLRGFVGNAGCTRQSLYNKRNGLHTFGQPLSIFAIVADNNDMSNLNR
jgi:hypothetical protein